MVNITINSTLKSRNEIVCRFTVYEEYPLYAVGRQNLLYYTIYLLLTLSNSVLAVLATVGNALILAAVWRTISLQTPTNVLLSGLAVSDFGVGLIAQPAFVVSLVNRFILSFHVWCSAFLTMVLTSYLFITISFLTITALTVERLLALKLHLRFQELINSARVVITLIIIWLIGTATQILRTRVPIAVFGYFTVSWVIVLAGVNTWCYWKIFQVVRHHQAQIHVEAPMSNRSDALRQNIFNLTRYKKTVFTMLYIHGFFASCYIPSILMFFSLRIDSGSTPVTVLLADVSGTVVFLNSSLNPLLYCWRIYEVKQAVKNILKAFL